MAKVREMRGGREPEPRRAPEEFPRVWVDFGRPATGAGKYDYRVDPARLGGLQVGQKLRVEDSERQFWMYGELVLEDGAVLVRTWPATMQQYLRPEPPRVPPKEVVDQPLWTQIKGTPEEFYMRKPDEDT